MEVPPSEGLGLDQLQHMELGQGADRLNEVKHKAGPTFGVGVQDPQTWVQPHGQRGQVPFRL